MTDLPPKNDLQMNTKSKAMTIISSGLAILAALTLAAWQIFGPQETIDPKMTSGILQKNSSTTIATNSLKPSAQRFVEQRKIVPGSYRALGPKAHEIIRNGEFRPPGDALVHVKQLATQSASGDANAAYEIYLTVNECKTFFSQRADLHADSAASVGAESEFLGKSERILNECSALVLEKDLDGAEWLSKAASMGSPEAMRGYAASPEVIIGPVDESMDAQKLSEWRENAQKYLLDLASQGNIAALADLEVAYAYGRFGSPDPSMALAYATAAKRANPGSVTEEDLDFYRRKLNQRELNKARDLSSSIFDNCCKTFKQD